MKNESYKEKSALKENGFFFGAGGGTRTHTVSLPTDFESVTSANSITPALPIDYIIIAD